MAYDLLIKNGRVVDGSGEPAFAADVAVQDGKIVGVGKYAGAAAKRTIDAAGRSHRGQWSTGTLLMVQNTAYASVRHPSIFSIMNNVHHNDESHSSSPQTLCRSDRHIKYRGRR